MVILTDERESPVPRSVRACFDKFSCVELLVEAT